ncbi:MAG: citramalate synthase [Actinobacteria bacterium]|uniref:(R)-citramalate synthase n=1 Tax=freshwater metagenome TaxID=449393 RepID=A0A6J6VNW2_9ZZZZ|nr:citramalate synthase [Actinomycetota bacterium]MSY73507.1 citramalate synthase [Actinomycetota bacterium]
MNTTRSNGGARTPTRVDIFDTTLRDGSQLEGISLTVGDKLRIAEQLDHLGVHYIEGGWPGANPKDEEFFRRARTELKLQTSTLVAFGSTRRVKGKVDDDATLRNLVEAGTSTVCIVGKAWDYHVLEALRTTLDEGVAMVAESIAFLKQAGLRVFFDAEHFFDGYRNNPEFSLRVLEGAAMAGVDCLVLCDTNGGSLPFDVERVVGEVVDHLGDTPIGIHLHNDTGCGVANALGAVRAGATQVQGTINGYGERVGNCDLVPIIANLSLKMGIATLPEGRLARLTSVAHHIAEIVNFTVDPQQPYVGSSAFAHKAGLHTSAISRRKDAYEHIDPSLVGNGTRFLVSEMSGRSTLELKAQELGLELDGKVLGDVVDQLKRLEHEGYHFEAADASLELLMRRASGWEQSYFSLESYKVLVRHRAGNGPGAHGDALDVETEATVKLWLGEERLVAIGEGNGPVNALDAALRTAIGSRFPALDRISLTDFKVRVLDTGKGTGAVTRVLLDSTNGTREWTTIGVSENIIEASWQALTDSLVYGLLHTHD